LRQQRVEGSGRLSGLSKAETTILVSTTSLNIIVKRELIFS